MCLLPVSAVGWWKTQGETEEGKKCCICVEHSFKTPNDSKTKNVYMFSKSVYAVIFRLSVCWRWSNLCQHPALLFRDEREASPWRPPTRVGWEERGAKLGHHHHHHRLRARIWTHTHIYTTKHTHTDTYRNTLSLQRKERNFSGERRDNVRCSASMLLPAKGFPFRRSQKPIKIARIRVKQQREAHKAIAETLCLFLCMCVSASFVYVCSSDALFPSLLIKHFYLTNAGRYSIAKASLGKLWSVKLLHAGECVTRFTTPVREMYKSKLGHIMQAFSAFVFQGYMFFTAERHIVDINRYFSCCMMDKLLCRS